MLIIFRSKAAANVLMLKDLTERLLTILGRELTSEGIFTVEQLPLAIHQLEAAIAHEKLKQSNQEQSVQHTEEQQKTEDLSLAQRAFPLLDMLRRAASKNEPVIWQTSSAVISEQAR